MSDTDEAIQEGTAQVPDTSSRRFWIRTVALFVLVPTLLVVLVIGILSTPLGKRFVANQISGFEAESGLSVSIGRINGDITGLFGKAEIRDVRVKDPKGEFLHIPRVSLDWRPFAWVWSGIDIREVVARRGRLERLPELLECVYEGPIQAGQRECDPEDPILPNFDIRIDSFEIEDFVIAPGVAGKEAQRVKASGKADIRKGRALVDLNGKLGTEDRIALVLDVEPEADTFDLDLDYIAPAGGVISGLTGLPDGYEARVRGDGGWERWLGHGTVTRWPALQGEDREPVDPESLAAFRLTNRAGEYALAGQIRPQLEGDSILTRSIGDLASFAAEGTFADSTFDGTIRAVTDALEVGATGSVDLGDNRIGDLNVMARLRDPELFGGGVELNGARLGGVIDGGFNSLRFDHTLRIADLQTPAARVRNIVQTGTARYADAVVTIPLDARVAQVVTGNSLIDPSLVGGTIKGVATYARSRFETDEAVVAFPGLTGNLALRGNAQTGTFALAGPVEVRGFDVDDVGKLSGNAKLIATFGTTIPWSVRANLAGRLTDVRNDTVADVAGNTLKFRAALGLAADKPIVFRDVVLDSDRLNARFDSRIVAGSNGTRTVLAGNGSHVDYGKFTFDAEVRGDGPRAVLVLANPYPSAWLKNVRVSLAPNRKGFALDVSGGSLLGAFEGELGLVLPANAPTRIDIDKLTVYRTGVSGSVTLANSGLSGRLAVQGGGLDGFLALTPAPGSAQGFEIDLDARRAFFGGETTLSIADADIFAKGTLDGDDTEVFADISGGGLEYGGLKIVKFAAKAAVEDKKGTVRGTIAGRRTDRFSLKFESDLRPKRITVLADGNYAGRRIRMPRRAVLTPLDAGGYRLAKTQVSYGRGYTIFEGELFGNETVIDAKLARMPLRLADLAVGELALGGQLSGDVSFRQRGNAAPTGDARIKIDNFRRAGLILSSQPTDITAVLDLTANRLSAAARISDDGRKLGRIDARISELGGGSDLVERIRRGKLNAKLTYGGSAEALWRLLALDTFDLTGPVTVNARATGTLINPRLSGSLASDNLRLQSAITGSDISGIKARGRFAGSKLNLTRFSGTTRGGGSISGSGTVDLAGISETRGPKLDLRAAVRNARILDAAGLDATLTGPLRIVSNGIGGSIAGRVTLDRGSWELGIAATQLGLPRIATRESPRGNGATARNTSNGSWRYLVNVKAPGNFEVDGLGLNSEWAADVKLRGTVLDPRLGGSARLVRGTYTFGGARFAMTRGRINFDANQPIDPRLDITAEASRNGTDVAISITGRSQAPRIALSSAQGLPEEEILSRLLFGGSVTTLSATDAVQLGAALTALQGGSGLDPIGDLRRSIGLDQLRIVAADPTTGQSTGVAVGKYLGNRAYIELISDGQGYSATRLEYRVTRWLTLLGTVSTIGRDSVLAEISRDY
ncbi:MAG: translocation/assembly module TamB domain-containing protein [Pseudomonadota bacterium]